jgi:hypothetical protein
MGEPVKYQDAPRTEGEGWQAVVAALDRLEDSMGQRHTENTSTLEVVQKELRLVIDRVDDLAKGFPEGDPEGHRRFHEVLIERATARTRFYEELRTELAKRGLWALVLAAVTAVGLALRTWLHIGVK